MTKESLKLLSTSCDLGWGVLPESGLALIRIEEDDNYKIAGRRI